MKAVAESASLARYDKSCIVRVHSHESDCTKLELKLAAQISFHQSVSVPLNISDGMSDFENLVRNL